MKITNNSVGPRGFHKGDQIITIERGETWDGDLTEREQALAEATGYFAFGNAAAKSAQKGVEESADLIEAARREVAESAQRHIEDLKTHHSDQLAAESDRADEAEKKLDAALAEIEDLKAQLAKFDPDGDGQTGGSQKSTPPALTGKNKDQLLQIAKDEEVEVAEGATNAEIVTAIETKRAA